MVAQLPAVFLVQAQGLMANCGFQGVDMGLDAMVSCPNVLYSKHEGGIN
jgi:hypothetical protein